MYFCMFIAALLVANGAKLLGENIGRRKGDRGKDEERERGETYGNRVCIGEWWRFEERTNRGT